MPTKATQKWLVDIPASWDTKKTRALFYSRDERNTNLQEDNILSVMKDVGVIRYADKGSVGNKSSDRPENYKIVHPNDIVANSMNLVIGSLGISKERGVTSSVYHILGARDDTVYPEFYEYVMRSRAFQKYAGSLGTGIMELREAVRWDTLRNIELPSPPLSLQRKIVNYLDKKLASIDMFIRNKEEYIKTLQERKQAIINNAVTKGLDKEAELVSSPYEWAGDVPKNWLQYKLRHITKFNPTRSISEYQQEDKVIFLPMEAVGTDGEYSNEQLRPYSEVSSGYTYFEEGDVLIAKITPCFENGKGAFLKELPTKIGYGTTEFHVMRPNKDKILGEYLYLYTMTHYFRSIGTAFMTGSAGQQRISSNFVKNFPIALPSITEQKTILAYVNQESKLIDEAITKARHQIKLIKEYRDSLITHAITGHIEIKE